MLHLHSEPEDFIEWSKFHLQLELGKRMYALEAWQMNAPV